MSSNDPGGSGSHPIAGALTYPIRDAEDSQPLPIQPRQPTNLQGLLRFAMEATKVEDAPRPSNVSPMDLERRRFLEQALRGFSVDVAEVLESAIMVLTNQEDMLQIQLTDRLPYEVEEAFDNVQEYVDNIDVANDFYKMGGFATFPLCLGSENQRLRERAYSLLGELCQNNPFCQAKALECGLVRVLLNLLHSEQGDALAKCIYALSCASREYPPACEVVVAEGCDALAALLRHGTPAVRTKACFFSRYLAHSYPEAKQKFIELNIIKRIGQQLKEERDWSTEHLLSVIMELVEDMNPTAVQQCSDPELDLKTTLENLLQHPDLQDISFQEEKEFAEKILKIVTDNPGVGTVTEEADR